MISLAALTPSDQFGAIRFLTPQGWSLFNPSIGRDGDGFAAVVRWSYGVRTAVGFDVNDHRDCSVCLDGNLNVRSVARNRLVCFRDR